MIAHRSDCETDAPAPVHDGALRPFDARTIEFLSDLSRTLSGNRGFRGIGEIQALAFWMRPAEIDKLRRRFAAIEGEDSVLVPRGTVFHVPPSNVDTIFVYSWALALLVGNRNVVRLSQRLGGIGADLASAIEVVLARPQHATVAAASSFVRYGHDDVRTAELSAQCDVRVLWGGDAAVTTLRRIPLPPHAIELVFPDRFSATALGVDAVAALGDPERDALADRFANDAFWFDQRACSSPRLVVWIGDESRAREIADDFWPRVAAAASRRGIHTDASTALAKLTEAARCAADERVDSVHRITPEVMVVRLRALEGFRRTAPGGGLFHEVSLPSLETLAPHLEKRDQTLGVFGIPRDTIVAAARVFNGQGIDRFVPVGQALAFQHVWDGYDLLQQFTRRVTVSANGW